MLWNVTKWPSLISLEKYQEPSLTSISCVNLPFPLRPIVRKNTHSFVKFHFWNETSPIFIVCILFFFQKKLWDPTKGLVNEGKLGWVRPSPFKTGPFRPTFSFIKKPKGPNEWYRPETDVDFYRWLTPWAR